VGNYYSTPIYAFRCKCHLCSGWFEFRTDPQVGATGSGARTACHFPSWHRRARLVFSLPIVRSGQPSKKRPSDRLRATGEGERYRGRDMAVRRGAERCAGTSLQPRLTRLGRTRGTSSMKARRRRTKSGSRPSTEGMRRTVSRGAIHIVSFSVWRAGARRLPHGLLVRSPAR
jgi:hypothetical protein